MKRSIITFIVFLAVQCGLSQGTGYWDLPSKSINGLNYFLFEETGEVMVADENCWEGELVLPTVVNWDGHDYPVKYLASRAFANCKSLTRVIIPENIQDILFYVSYLGNRDIIKSPFQGCSQLESIEVAENNRWLCSVDGVLYKHDRTQLFNYPSGASRTHFAIPEGVETIGTAAFRGSANLTSVSIPNTVNQIFEEAFYDCDNIKQIDIPDNISTIKISTFHGCSKLKSIHLPDNLTEIENAAFFGCLSLKEIVFPEKLQTLGGAVFRGCQLETVVIKGYLYDYSIKNLLQDLNESAKLYVPASEVDRYKSLYSGTVLPLEEYEGRKETQEYFPEGTKWTEIRLDTLKYDSWYSKVGDEWVPNFETIEYRVQGTVSNVSWDAPYKCVYSRASEWTDSLSLLVQEASIKNVDRFYDKCIIATLPSSFTWGSVYPTVAYTFDWRVGMPISFIDILSTTYDHNSETAVFGIIEEINEENFGGVRPLNYTDVNGVRIIQGIGVTTWNDGECIFGPVRPYDAMAFHQGIVYPERHYRSMLVHFERGGEVLYDVWPKKEAIEVESVTFTRDQMATIILPTEPDASKGKYYRLDRVEGNEIVFEQELQPCAHVPYIIVPGEDFSIEVDAMELDGLRCDTASVEGISFIGTFQKEEVESQEGFYIELIDTTPDCSLSPSGEAGRDVYTIGTLRAYLLVHWDDPYHPGGTKVPAEKMEIVLKDNPDSIEIVNSKSSNSKCYDLSGKMVNRKSSNSKFPRGIYIEGGKVKIY